MRWSRIKGRLLTTLLVIGMGVLTSGVAGATGSHSWHRGGYSSIDDVFPSLDGTLEFSDFKFFGIDPDEVEIEVGESSITFSGDISLDGFDWDAFRIGYTVRALDGQTIVGTQLDLDSEVRGKGAVLATKKIKAPREREPWLPLVSFPSWGDDWDDGKGHHHRPHFEHIGKLVAFNIASGWVCGCGHHHDRIEDVEKECSIERDSDRIAFDDETTLKILDSIKLLS
ncbi:MAG: hypothetical protein ACR2P8_05435, partial [Myxococcota bacterium]